MKKPATLLALAMVLILSAVFAAPACCSDTNSRKVKMYRVYYDKAFFKADRDDGKYEPGSTVSLFFPTADTDIRYGFFLTGAKRFSQDYEPGKGYTIRFEMPKGIVGVYYRVEEPFKGIALSMKENPTTGYRWEYTIAPEGILKMVESRYTSDPDNGEPVCGKGGTHFWKFKVVGSGTAEIRFVSRRGPNEEAPSVLVYRYRCDGKTATLEKKYVIENY